MGRPRLLSESRFDDDFSIASDGRIAAVKKEPKKTSSDLTVVLNFAEELRRRLPPQ